MWIIEPYTIWNHPIEQHTIHLDNLYKNILWIRKDIRKAKCIDKIEFGIKDNNIAFHYIPPNVKKKNFIREEIESRRFQFSMKQLEIKNIIWNQGTINLVAWLYAPPLKQMLLLRK